VDVHKFISLFCQAPVWGFTSKLLIACLAPHRYLATGCQQLILFFVVNDLTGMDDLVQALVLHFCLLNSSCFTSQFN
jgi:hypothetical protein